MNAPLTHLTLLAAMLFSPAPAVAHTGHARSKEIEIGHEIRVSPGSLEIRQTQAYSGKMAMSLLSELDADNDGRVSDAERAAGQTEGVRQFAEAMIVAVDWRPAEPISSTATFLSLPSPGGQPLATVQVTARYKFPPEAGARPLSIDIGALNANRITAAVEFAAPLEPLKSNVGRVEGRRVAEMLAATGSPERFEILFRSEEEPAPRSASPGGVPPAAAAAAAGVLFLIGLALGRRPSPSEGVNR